MLQSCLFYSVVVVVAMCPICDVVM